MTILCPRPHFSPATRGAIESLLGSPVCYSASCTFTGILRCSHKISCLSREFCTSIVHAPDSIWAEKKRTSSGEDDAYCDWRNHSLRFAILFFDGEMKQKSRGPVKNRGMSQMRRELLVRSLTRDLFPRFPTSRGRGEKERKGKVALIFLYFWVGCLIVQLD